MKKVKMETEFMIPETIQECNQLLSGEPGDDEYINYLSCVGCAYESINTKQCKHRDILLALEKDNNL